jgi:hypothetical protein
MEAGGLVLRCSGCGATAEGAAQTFNEMFQIVDAVAPWEPRTSDAVRLFLALVEIAHGYACRLLSHFSGFL